MNNTLNNENHKLHITGNSKHSSRKHTLRGNTQAPLTRLQANNPVLWAVPGQSVVFSALAALNILS